MLGELFYVNCVSYVCDLLRAQPQLLLAMLPKLTQDPRPKFHLQRMTIVDHCNYIGIGLGKSKSKLDDNNQLDSSGADTCLFLSHHHFRPKFLQYRYMYDYRTNYYNDVIDYLDKRAKGQKVDVPRAQTWAERVLRTHTKYVWN